MKEFMKTSKILIKQLKVENKILLENTELILTNGTITELIGQSGVGKTSLARYLINEGKINISYSPQNFILFEHYYPIECAKKIIKIKNKLFDQNDFIKKLDYLKIPKDLKIKKLSNGQKMRLQVLIVLELTADFYILDEPFASLDPKTINILVNYLETCKKTILLINHHQHLNLKSRKLLIQDQKISIVNNNILKKKIIHVTDKIRKH